MKALRMISVQTGTKFMRNASGLRTSRYLPQMMCATGNNSAKWMLFSEMHRLFSTTSDVAPSNPSSLERASSDGVVGRPIDFDVSAKIEGNESQILTVTLEPGQVLRAESGAMMYMTEGVEMNTTSGGGISSGFARMLTGQNFFISDYTYTGDAQGEVALGTDFPSKIMRINLEEYGGKVVCQKGALLCASHTGCWEFLLAVEC